MRLILKQETAQASILVLGMFDGVHLGHQALINKALSLKTEKGLPVTVCTFDKHPLSVLRSETAPPMLSTLTERAKAMARLKVDTLCVLHFTKKMASITPEAFLARLVRAFKPKAIVVGYNYSFGRAGKGNGAFLRAKELEYGYTTHIIPSVEWEGEAVSSTRIRELLAEGLTYQANTLLTRAYGITGVVEQGKHIGRTLGFPTANIALPNGKVIPRFGVYTALLREGDKVYPCVLNVGSHPTLPQGHATVEAHILTGTVDLYDKKVRISFLGFLRPEMKFDSVGLLRDQIERDVQGAKAFFGDQAESAWEFQ